jgi:hypothetical protein
MITAARSHPDPDRNLKAFLVIMRNPESAALLGDVGSATLG